MTRATSRRRPSNEPADVDSSAAPPPRLQKVLAAAGLGSRRNCEELILAGRVEIDRQVANRLGTRVDPRHHEVRVDGVALPRIRTVYYMLHKPTGVVCTNRDPAGRTRAVDLLPSGDAQLFTVGRLDMSSEGLILATNDGDLANRLAHPRYGVEKTYLVEVAGRIGALELTRLTRGIHLAEGRARVASARIKSVMAHSTLLEIVLDEGRNREIRRLLARTGHKVLRLRRIALGSLRLGELAPGEYRPLDHQELRALRETAGVRRARKAARPQRRPSEKPKSAGPARTVIGGSHAKPPRPHGKAQNRRRPRTATKRAAP